MPRRTPLRPSLAAWRAAPVLGVLLAACTPDEGPGPASDSGTEPAAGIEISDLRVVVNPIVPTVAVVSWRTDVPSLGSVSFQEVGGSPMTATASEVEALEHQALVVGLPEAVDAELQVIAANDQGLTRSETVRFTTGQLSAAIPRPTLADPLSAAKVTGFTLAPMARGEERWVTILDPSGRLVWAWGDEEVWTQRARLTQDGLGVIMTDQPNGSGMDLMRVDFDGTVRWTLHIPDGHHDFDLIDDQTFVVLATELREVELQGGPQTLAGDALVQVDLDGGRRVLWSAWDHFVPDPDMALVPTDPPGSYDWTHGNFVRYDPQSDAVQLILRDVSTAVEVDRQTGQTRWTLSEKGGDYVNTGSQPLLGRPHSIWPVDGGVLVFNQNEFELGECADAALLQLDPVAGTAARSWTYTSESCFQVGYLGNAQALDGGRALVSFGTAGLLDEVDTATGQLLWRVQLDSPSAFLYVERFDAFGARTP